MAKARVFPCQIRCPSGPASARAAERGRARRARAPVGAAGVPASGDDRRRVAPLRRGVSGRCALCRQVQPGAARPARGLGRRHQAFRLRLAARDRAGAPPAAPRRGAFHAPGQSRARRSTPRFASTASPISRSTARTSWKRSCRRRCGPSWSARRRCWACSCASRSGRAAPTICRANSASRSRRRASCCALARPHAARLGLCFHVGSQCLDPAAYARAMALAADAVALSGVAIDVVDVGGGFPVSYPDVVPPPLDDYVAAIGEAAARVRRRHRPVGRAGAGAGGGRRVGGRAGAAAPRRRALRQ